MTSFAFYLATFLLLLFLVILGLYLYFRLCGYLRKNHHAQWVELGKPSPMHNTIASNFLCGRYLLMRKYRSSADPILIRRCDVLLAYSLCLIAVFVLVNIFIRRAEFIF